MGRAKRPARFTDLDDAAEVGAEERRGGAGGPAPLGRGRRQHLCRLLLPWRLPTALLSGSAAASAPVDSWSSGAWSDLVTVAVTAAASRRDLARCLGFAFAVLPAAATEREGGCGSGPLQPTATAPCVILAMLSGPVHISQGPTRIHRGFFFKESAYYYFSRDGEPVYYYCPLIAPSLCKNNTK